MRKLLAANGRLLLKSRLFWMELFFCALFSAWIMVANYSPRIQESDTPLRLEDSFFNLYPLLCVVFAAAISLIGGTEYSDGTIRNKLMVGHSRAEVYFSMLFMNIGMSIAVIATHGIVSYAVGYFLFGVFHLTATQILIALGCALLANLVFTTLFSAIVLNCSSKATTAVVSLFASLGIIFAASFVGNRLLEPEMTYDGIMITENGIQYGDLLQNPNYISGIMRILFEYLYDLLPTGQLIQIQSLDLLRWQYWILWSVLLFVAVTVIGYKQFSKKDIS